MGHAVQRQKTTAMLFHIVFKRSPLDMISGISCTKIQKKVPSRWDKDIKNDEKILL